MLGYLNAPSPFDADGWFNTQDLVETDGDYIRILGRKSELINVGGEKVHPTEIENVLLQLDNVKDVTVRGRPNPITGEVVAAKITRWWRKTRRAQAPGAPILSRAARALQDSRRHRRGLGGSLQCPFQEVAHLNIDWRAPVPATMANRSSVTDTTTRPKTGKVALVSGGSRGLGAELVSGSSTGNTGWRP